MAGRRALEGSVGEPRHLPFSASTGPPEHQQARAQRTPLTQEPAVRAHPRCACCRGPRVLRARRQRIQGGSRGPARHRLRRPGARACTVSLKLEKEAQTVRNPGHGEKGSGGGGGSAQMSNHRAWSVSRGPSCETQRVGLSETPAA